MSDSSSTNPKRFGRTFWIVLIIGLVVAGSTFFRNYSGISDRATTTKAVNQIRQLLLACRAYSMEHEDAYPPSLEVLYPEFMDYEPFLYWEEGNQKLPMIYHPGHRFLDSSELLLIEHPASFDGRRIIGTAGGVITVLEAEDPAQYRLKASP